MPMLPCILCGKEINAFMGSNTVYCPPDGHTYACCSGGCGRPEGAYDSSYVQAQIRNMSEEERLKHRES